MPHTSHKISRGEATSILTGGEEKALAEAAALLVLEKKVRDLLGEPEDGKSTWRSEKP